MGGRKNRLFGIFNHSEIDRREDKYRNSFFPGKVEHLKLLGYSKESAEDYYQLSPFRMFDTLFFLRSTTATVPLFEAGEEL